MTVNESRLIYFSVPDRIRNSEDDDSTKQKFMDLWNQSRHIVVTKFPDLPSYMRDGSYLNYPEESCALFSMPFKTIFLEVFGDVIRMKTYRTQTEVVVGGFLADERAPGEIKIYTFGMDVHTKRPSCFDHNPNPKGFAHRLFMRTLAQINSADFNVGSVKVRGKLKAQLGEKQKEIKRIVVCTPKKERDGANRILNRDVDWSHKWEVRGHWRKCDSIGKDREGNYSVNGFTWVREHEKGKGELVIKSRFFKSIETNNGGAA